MRLLKKIRNKKGDTLVFTMLILTVALFFTALLVDIGLGYSNRVHMQHIADAASIGGASAGKEGYSSIVDGKIFADINEKKATSVANNIIKENKKYLMDRVDITAYAFNRSGKVIDGKAMNWRDQYYSGNFTVSLWGRYKTMFIDGKFLGMDINIPFLNFFSESRVHVTPKVVNP
jgi:hypothetical protein